VGVVVGGQVVEIGVVPDGAGTVIRTIAAGGGVRASAFGSSSFPEIVSSSREASCCAPALAGALFCGTEELWPRCLSTEWAF
jgi:hypothetical protein